MWEPTGPKLIDQRILITIVDDEIFFTTDLEGVTADDLKYIFTRCIKALDKQVKLSIH